MYKNLNIIFMSAILLVTLLFSLFMFVRDNWYSREVSPLPKPEEFVLQDLAGTSLFKEIKYSPGKEPVYCDTTMFSSLAIQPAQNLAITCGTGYIKIYYLDGRVEIPEGVSLPEASTVFWNAVGNAFPAFKQAIIAEH